MRPTLQKKNTMANAVRMKLCMLLFTSCSLQSGAELFKVWLTNQCYHDNLFILMLLNQWLVLTMLGTTDTRLLWQCSCRANHTVAASLLTLVQTILCKNCNLFLMEKTGKKTNPILRLDCHRQPSNYATHLIVAMHELFKTSHLFHCYESSSQSSFVSATHCFDNFLLESNLVGNQAKYRCE